VKIAGVKDSIVVVTLPAFSSFSAFSQESSDVASGGTVIDEADRDTKLQFEQCAYDCIGKCWPSTADTQGDIPFRRLLWLLPASEMTYIVSGGALNLTHSLTRTSVHVHSLHFYIGSKVTAMIVSCCSVDVTGAFLL